MRWKSSQFLFTQNAVLLSTYVTISFLLLFSLYVPWMGAGLACSHFRLPTFRGQPSRFFPSLSINSRSLEMLTNLSTTNTRLTLCFLVGLQPVSLALGRSKCSTCFFLIDFALLRFPMRRFRNSAHNWTHPYLFIPRACLGRT